MSYYGNAQTQTKKRGAPNVIQLMIIVIVVGIIGIPLSHVYFDKEGVRLYLVIAGGVIGLLLLFSFVLIIVEVIQDNKRESRLAQDDVRKSQEILVESADLMLANFVGAMGHIVKPATEEAKAVSWTVKGEKQVQIEQAKAQGQIAAAQVKGEQARLTMERKEEIRAAKQEAERIRQKQEEEKKRQPVLARRNRLAAFASEFDIPEIS